MIRIFSAPDIESVYAVRDLLEDHGISVHVFNENVNMLSGALFNRTPDAWPAVYISDNNRIKEARALIMQFEKSISEQEASKEQPWRCSSCGEENAETFEICWKCGKPKNK